MEDKPKGQWMSLAEIQEETGLSRCTIYKAASENTLPVPVFRFGKRILVSRQAWEALHEQQHKVPRTEGGTDGAQQ